MVGKGDRDIGHRHLPGTGHLVAMRQAADRPVGDGDQEALARDAGVAKDGIGRVADVHPAGIEVVPDPGDAGDVAGHPRRLAEQHLHRHVDRELLARLALHVVAELQISVRTGNSHNGIRAALALGEPLEAREVRGGDG